MAKLSIQEIIAKAIQDADNAHCPEGYAYEAIGFGDHDWLSDWNAFLADRVLCDLHKAGLMVVGITRTRGKPFRVRRLRP